MPQNIFVFPDEDVIVSIPEKSGRNDIIVGKKDLNSTLPFVRPVINLWVYYYDRDQEKVAVTTFNPRMEIWIGYKVGEDNLNLFYWDVEEGMVAIPEVNKVRNWHKNQVYEGYGHVEVRKWPADPNLGWV